MQKVIRLNVYNWQHFVLCMCVLYLTRDAVPLISVQESGFCYDPSSNEPQEILHDCLFREGLTLTVSPHDCHLISMTTVIAGATNVHPSTDLHRPTWYFVLHYIIITSPECLVARQPKVTERGRSFVRHTGKEGGVGRSR